MQNVGRMRWSELEAMDDAGVMEQAKDYGLMNGAAIAIVLLGSRSVAGFARADREYEAGEMLEMEDLLSQLHRATIGLGRLSAGDQRALTALSIKLTH